MNINVAEQKQELNKLLSLLHNIEATEVLFGGVDEKYLQEKRADFEWQYRSEFHRIGTTLLNKGNARVYQPENAN